MTKRVKMVVAYDGTNYCGWQKQPNGICIEEVLNRELSKLLNEPIEVIGASRTDSGVHARGNIAVFDTHARMPADKILYRAQPASAKGYRNSGIMRGCTRLSSEKAQYKKDL